MFMDIPRQQAGVRLKFVKSLAEMNKKTNYKILLFALVILVIIGLNLYNVLYI